MKKILAVFFLAVVLSFIIYKITYKENDYILIIGENDNYTQTIIKDLSNNKIQTFLYDNITYKELIKAIKNNDYVIIKDKKIYLNQLIASSKNIIIYAGNKDYCNRNKITSTYKNNRERDILELKELINKFSSASVNVIENKC